LKEIIVDSLKWRAWCNYYCSCINPYHLITNNKNIHLQTVKNNHHCFRCSTRLNLSLNPLFYLFNCFTFRSFSFSNSSYFCSVLLTRQYISIKLFLTNNFFLLASASVIVTAFSASTLSIIRILPKLQVCRLRLSFYSTEVLQAA
jgi:hypothetical protein